jgi:hypothetical protein
MSVRACYVCKQEIDAERAEAQPNTQLCPVHAAEIAKYGGEFITWSEPVRSDKGAIKVNIGSYEVGKRRNQEALDRLRDDYLLSKEQK